MSQTNSSIDENARRLLDFTVGTRERIITELMPEGKFPIDNDDRKVILSALDGIDRTVLGAARVKAEEKANETQQQQTELVAELLQQFSVKSLMSETPVRRQEVLTLEGEFSVEDGVSGETDIGTQHLTYDEFFASPE